MPLPDGAYVPPKDPLRVWSLTEQYRLVKPDPIRRPRPVDLFRNATPWRVTVERIKHKSSSDRWSEEPYRASASGPSSYWGTYRETGGPMTLNLLDFQNADLRLRLKIKDQKVDLLAAMAEAKKTASLLTGAATDIVQAFTTLRRGRPLDAVRRLLSDPRTRTDRAVARRWLEYQWGVLPVLYDIYGAAEALAVKAHDGWDYSVAARVTTTTTGKIDIGLARGSWRRYQLTRAVARYRIASPDMLQLGALGITNPIASLYQVIPWSFALDWISNTGQILEGLDALMGVTQLFVQRSGGIDAWYDYSFDKLGGGAAGYEKLRERLGVQRDVLGFGEPRLRPFTETNQLGTRLVNVLALTRQLLR